MLQRGKVSFTTMPNINEATDTDLKVLRDYNSLAGNCDTIT